MSCESMRAADVVVKFDVAGMCKKCTELQPRAAPRRFEARDVIDTSSDPSFIESTANGAYTRPLLSSTGAVSDIKYTLNAP